MFAYCNSDPVNTADYGGTRAVVPEPLISISEEQLRYIMFFADIRNFDIFNTDVQMVYNSNFFSMYNGSFVVRHSNDYLTSWALGGIIFLNHSNDTKKERTYTLNHEYGHILQETEFGTAKYIASVFLPSTIYNLLSRDSEMMQRNYYNMPWEKDANLRTNVPWGDAWWAEPISDCYFRLWS